MSGSIRQITSYIPHLPRNLYVCVYAVHSNSWKWQSVKANKRQRIIMAMRSINTGAYMLNGVAVCMRISV